MDEILKRLNEIKAEAREARKLEDRDERIAKLKELGEESRTLQAELAEVQAIEGAPDEPAESPDEVGDEDEAPAEEPAPAEAPAEDDGDEAPAEEPAAPAEVPEEPVSLAAAANAAQPVDNKTEGEPFKAQALVASGNVGGTNPGDTLGTNQIERIHKHASRSGSGGNSVTALFASIAVRDGDVVSGRNTPDQNSLLLARADKKIQPITAAAAFCGPTDINLDINAVGTAARPVANLFGSVPVRGPFSYMKTATLADVSPGVNIWEEADQLAVDPADAETWKPDVDMTCRTETEVTPYAIVASTTIGTWQQLSAPEQVANWLEQMEKQYARVAEIQLLDRIRAQSHVYAHNNGLGLWSAIQPLLANTSQVVAQVNRATTEGYVLVVPRGTLDVMAADETMKGFSQNVAKQRIRALLQENYGISVEEALETDSTIAAAYRTGATDIGTKTLGTSTAFTPGDASALTTPLYLLRPDSFVMGQSDVVDAGYHRDANLIRQNLVRYFYEGMEFLEKLDDSLSFVYNVTACPSGMATALVDGPDCTP